MVEDEVLVDVDVVGGAVVVVVDVVEVVDVDVVVVDRTVVVVVDVVVVVGGGVGNTLKLWVTDGAGL